MKLRVASWLAILLLALQASPVLAQWFYDNGPINGNEDAWPINNGYVVSDSFVAGESGTFLAFDLGVWELPRPCALCGMTSVQWSITSGENSGTMYGYGTAFGDSLSDKFLSINSYGYEIDLIRVDGAIFPNYFTPGQTYWLNLWNAVVPGAGPVYWDENGGAGCGGNGGGKNCPSLASENFVGTIPSEAFTFEGCACGCNQSCSLESAGSTPEPSSIVLFGSGVLCLAGVLRRRLNL